jgi:hypothetical protein
MYVLPTTELSEIVLYVIYRRAIVDGKQISDQKDVFDGLLEIGNPPQIRLALNSLLNRKLIVEPFDSTRPVFQCEFFMITDEGVSLVEERLYAEDSSYIALFRDNALDSFAEDYIEVVSEAIFEQAPASDRLVEFDHNSSEFQSVEKELAQLDAALEKGNDIGEMTSRDVEAARGELSSLRLLIKQAVVRANIVFVRASELVGWITKKAGATLVAELAKKALEVIIKLLG